TGAVLAQQPPVLGWLPVGVDRKAWRLTRRRARSVGPAIARMASKIATTVASQARRGSAEALTLAGRCGGLDRVEHSMARDPVVEGGTEARSLAVVAGETRVRLGDVVGRAEFLLRPPIVLRHRKGLERRLGAGAATY